MNRSRTFRPTYFAYPYVVVSAIFVILPLLLVFVYAFMDAEGNFTFGNFVQVFTEKSNFSLLLDTIGIALITTVVCLLISYPVAMILASSPFNKKTILALLFVIPMWMNFVLRIIALKSLLDILGIGYSYTAAVIGMVYDFLPFMLLPIYTVLTNMDKSYLEASADLGAGKARTFFKVTLPLSLPGVISGVTMVFMPVFSAYAVTGMLGDAQTGVLGGKINGLFSSASTWGVGSALAFVLLLLVILVMIVSNVLARKSDKGVKKPLGGAM